MGYALRYFVFDEEGQVLRVPNYRFRRVVRGEEAYPPAAGQPLRYVELFITLKNRLPVSIMQASFRRLQIEEDGFHDYRKYSMLPFLSIEEKHRKDNVVNLQQHLLKKKWEWREWTPTPEEMAAMKEKLPHLTE